MVDKPKRSFARMKRVFDIALTEARFSPDKRLKVGAVVTDSDLNVLSTGHNAKPIASESYSTCVNATTGKSCNDLLHAEVRALFNAGRNQTKNAFLFVTHCPCERCAGVIAEAGIKTVYFLENHDDGAGAKLLQRDYGIDVCQVMNVRRSIDNRIRKAELAAEELEDSIHDDTFND